MLKKNVSQKFLSLSLSLFLLSTAVALPVYAETTPSSSPSVMTTPSAVTTPPVAAASPIVVQEEENSMTPIPMKTMVPVPEQTPSSTATPAAVQPTKSPDILTTLSLTITAQVQYFPYIIPSTAVLRLSDQAGNTYYAQADLGSETDTLTFQFDLPEYAFGDSFNMTLESGLQGLQYYDMVIGPGESVSLQTYAYISEETSELVEGNTFIMGAIPCYEKALTIFRDYNALSLNPRARIIDGVAMVPVRPVANALEITDVSYNAEYNSVRVAVGSKELLFNIGTTYTTWDGFDFYAPAAPQIIEDCTYVPLRTLAEAFESEITVFDEGDHMDINLGQSMTVWKLRNSSIVNSRGITSKTNYLIWISKSEYKVRVYQGSQYNWELIHSFSCAIGAPSSPTVTGQFEYYERISRWPYANFYVGPVMRFYGGYAIHSTLLRYDGSDYDSRTGVQISHGCVRVQPANMNWLIHKIPMYTRIYVTD